MKRKISNTHLACLFASIGLFILLISNSNVAADAELFTPQADAFVLEMLPTRTSGSLPIIRAQSGQTMHAYLKFDLQSVNGTISSALLRLHTMDDNAAGFQVHQVADNNWSEDSITFQNAPALGEVIATYDEAVDKGNWVTIDVSSYVTESGIYSFGLTSDSTGRLRWRSSETSQAPELLIQLNADSTPQPTNTATPQPTTPPTAVPTNTPAPTNTPMPTATAVPTDPPPTPTANPGPQGGIVVDHTSVAKFHEIPEQYLQAAANLHMFFVGRSVSTNINDGLTCLSYATDEAAPNHCARYIHRDPAFSVDPSLVNWDRPGGYDRSNWVYQYWAGTNCSFWYGKVGCFIEMTEPVIDQYDVVSLQFSYLEVGFESSIADQPGGFFWNNPNRLDVHDLELYEAAHPNTTFIYSTANLSRALGSDVSDAFNQQMRNYAITNGKPLFDIAAILSHDPDGNPCYDNRDGVYYSNGNNFENHPDDNDQNMAICPHYTTETDGGHLGSVSAGKIRVAQAYWVLMAQIAGWDGNSQ